MTPQVLKVTSSFATQFLSCCKNDIVAVSGPIPQILKNCSTPIDGPAPANAILIDGAAFVKTSRKRMKPDKDARLTKADILRLLDWDDDQFEVALSLGFPAGTLQMKWNEYQGAPTSAWKTYSASDVEDWRLRVNLLGLRP